MIEQKRTGVAGRVRILVLVAATVGVTMRTAGQLTPETARSTLSPYMNAIPPSKDYLCVGIGAANRALHPDRAPHTDLAQQDGVILFTGAAPQQGLNFQLTAGTLVYRNQMSTLGKMEPAPQVGAAGQLLENPGAKTFFPWSEARWHQGEDITWQGYRRDLASLAGLPYWNYEGSEGASPCGTSDLLSTFPPTCRDPLHPSSGEVYKPCVALSAEGAPGSGDPIYWGISASYNLQLSRGIYQATRIRYVLDDPRVVCPDSFREPWFQAYGRYPAFNVDPDGAGSIPRLAETYFPNFLSIYPYRELDLDGGRLKIGFERSATWPREAGKEIAGTVMAEDVRDEYENQVVFDRVPKYGWETDYKTPWAPSNNRPSFVHDNDASLADTPDSLPAPNAWRLPHKRIRTVQLNPKDSSAPVWTVAFVYEHPESDRISVHDTPPVDDALGDAHPYVDEWKSIYSFLPQADWNFGRVPELDDETTLLTVQAYKGDVTINGAAFQDDYSVWGSTVSGSKFEATKRVNKKAEYEGNYNNDGCPGICGIDDDGDGLVDEDCSGLQPAQTGYGSGCTMAKGDSAVPDYLEDDNEDDIVEYKIGIEWQGTQAAQSPTDPYGDVSGDGAPGLVNVDDDGDGLIDENSDGYQAYLAFAQSSVECTDCQRDLFKGVPNEDCYDTADVLLQTHLAVPADKCWNPLYWRGELVADEWEIEGAIPLPIDSFAHHDDDEDGLYDEDGADDPLLVNLRATSGECASGFHPFLPASRNDNTNPNPNMAELPGATERIESCLPALRANQDPWVHQVQYVYARSNPYWLLSARDTESDPTKAAYGTIRYLKQPQYYYFPPFSPDLNEKNGTADTLSVHGEDGNAIKESDLIGLGTTGEFLGMVVDSSQEGDNDGLPNVHPDCVPDPKFRGPASKGYVDGNLNVIGEPNAPGDIHLIKRIVRTRPDSSRPSEFTEQTWLYRYNDFGFLKAVFDPASVQALIDAPLEKGQTEADDLIKTPDDILKYSDTFEVGGRPLIKYASQWYTFYMPYVDSVTGYGGETDFIPACYDQRPVLSGRCSVLTDGNAPYSHLPQNACDGERLWEEGYASEMHVDPTCSDMMHQDCGWCYSIKCRPDCLNCGLCPDCMCPDGLALEEGQLKQMGIPGAQPRWRRYMIKTARVRGGDGEMHLYRFDYLGAASSVYDHNSGDRVVSYADPHNITIVDELVEQEEGELGLDDGSTGRNEFYIYEDDFKIVLDGAESRPGGGEGTPYFSGYGKTLRHQVTSYYMHFPVKVKTRRVVTMNYYGIATSDRLILTPGYQGDQSSLVDDQQYELVNQRGQLKQAFDPSWVAALRNADGDINAVKTAGRVFVELFGGTEGWYSALRGVAWGSSGGNLYDQQCETPEVLGDVPVQRVAQRDMTVIGATSHSGEGIVRTDLPVKQVQFYNPPPDTELSFEFGTTSCVPGATGNIICDPAGTIGLEDCGALGELDTIDLHIQLPVEVALSYTDSEGDGASLVQYHYVFHGEGEDAVKWKWRWQETVSPSSGGTGNVALEAWYHDTSGQIRFYGRGSGDVSGQTPATAENFYVTYYEYDEWGRLVLQVDDCNPADEYFNGVLGDDAGFIARKDEDNDPANLATRTEYNDAGTVVARTHGLTTALSNFALGVPDDGSDVIRTEYAFVPHRNITYEWTEDYQGVPVTHWGEAWSDDYAYQIEYQHANGMGQVYGTTSVNVLDRSGKPIEQRVLAWNSDRAQHATKSMTDKIEADETGFGWGISLADYTYDGAIGTWELDAIPSELWECSDDVQCGGTSGAVLDPELTITPEFPTSTTWPPDDVDQLVTLSQRFKLYRHSSSLKPSHDLVFRSFEDAPDPLWEEPEEDPRAVTKRYDYDLEDRIARVENSDGTIERYLFDSKRRPTKVFRGSIDGCADWFPPEPNLFNNDDDMILTQHNLYNDGFECREFNPLPGEDTGAGYDPCSGGNVGPNDNFPKNAGRLVRTRRFVDNAESCGGYYAENTRSRDTQIVYDWRGRPVIAKEVAVGNNEDPVKNPDLISYATMVYDNLDRPVLIATWPPSGGTAGLPTDQKIEIWEGIEPSCITPCEWDDVAVQMLEEGAGPLTLSQTLYDERGRPYEQRTYDVSDGTGGTYTFSRTYRDDLNRVTAELNASGLVVNKYDSLGRVVETSHWTDEAPASPGEPDTGDGTELTSTQTRYDAFGNVLWQINYDRTSPDNASGLIPDKPIIFDATDELSSVTTFPHTSDAIVTFTANWYDNAKRLAATAYYGTNGPDGFTHGSAPLYERSDPPAWDGSKYSTDATADLTGEALVTCYGYDTAGRRIWTQDAKGIVSRTWYDMLGRTLLEAENWKDFPGADSGGIPGIDLTPNHSGPIRYTAYHFTRGGLMDVIAAIIPDDPATNLNITPDDIDWSEVSGEDYAAGDSVDIEIDATVGDAHFQLTRLVYGADMLAESNQATILDSADWPSIVPNLVSEIQYPDYDEVNPNYDDVVTLRYTIDGKLASRRDQRGVELFFEYGACEECSGNGGKLSSVTADFSGADADVATDVKRLAFDYNERGQLTKASSYDDANETTLLNQVTFGYEPTFGNLTSEKLRPHSNLLFELTTQYVWDKIEPGQPVNRLETIKYPTLDEATVPGATIVYDPNMPTRVTGIRYSSTDVTTGADVVKYERTGGGRTKRKMWGPNTTEIVSINYEASAGVSDASTFDLPGTDRFGRLTNMTFRDGSGNLLHRYEYGYDANGNRLFERVEQAGNNNVDRSFLYDYDRLNRLKFAEYGQLDHTTYDIDNLRDLRFSGSPKGLAWELDLLGNISGGSVTNGSYLEYDADLLTPGFDSETPTYMEHHAGTDTANEIGVRHVNADGTGGATPTTFLYDDAGNLTESNASKYIYDAWDRLVEVRRVSDDAVQGQFAYDALGRRINRKTTLIPKTYNAGEFYYYDGNRIISVFRVNRYSTTDCSGCGPGSEKSVTGSTDGVYQKPGTAAENDADPSTPDYSDPKLQTQMTLPCCQTTVTYPFEHERDLIYGTEYIDEHVAHYYPEDDALRYVLQDANYNVVAYTDEAGALLRQYSYHPYGKVLTAETGTGTPTSTLDSLALFQGLLFDGQTATYNNRGRIYLPEIMRFLQRDPNGTGKLVSTAMAMNAQTRRAFADLSVSSQYGDGLYLYGFAGGNPLVRRDPSGRRSLVNMVGTASIQGGLLGMVLGSLGGAFGELFQGDASWSSVGSAAFRGGAAGFAGGAAGGAAAAGMAAWTGTAGLLAIMAGGVAEGAVEAGVGVALEGASFQDAMAASLGGAILGGVTAGTFGKIADWWKVRKIKSVGGRPTADGIQWGGSGGPLEKSYAGAFAGGIYRETVTTEPTTLYRVWGGESPDISHWWSPTRPSSITRSNMALPDDNTAGNLMKIVVPAGETIYTGTAAVRNGQLGGGIQVFIEEVSRNWVTK